MQLPGTLFVILLFCFACTEKNPYAVDSHLTKKDQENVLRKTIRYSTNLAPRATQADKFDKEFDWYYENAIKEYEVISYFPSKQNFDYFLFNRKARSITPMKEAIGGKLRFNEKGELDYYEETFRTWKMNEDTLKKRSAILFDKMVKGEDLTGYRSKVQGDKFIEFPDDRFYFNKDDRKWHDKAIDSMQMDLP
jgi:hypothetical protein